MIKPFYEVIIIIPVGPGSNLAFVVDTIESVVYYTTSSFKILVADDSQEQAGKALQHSFPAIDIICSEKKSGSMAGLYMLLSKAFSHALQHYHFFLALKLDTDALIIGYGAEQTALASFAIQPNLAIAGQYPLDYNGLPWDIEFPRARIFNGTMTWKFIKRPLGNFVLRKLFLRALQNGYRTGESVFGGAYFISKVFLDNLQHRHLLPDSRLRVLNLGEDHLFSLLAKSVGMELGNLSGSNLPFGCAWKGLPVSPEKLLQDGKKIIHSTRGWEKMTEEEIRQCFKQKRQQLDHPAMVTSNHHSL